jgi:uncharacterized membrane protein
MKRVTTAALTAVAAAALLETALIPGLIIGASAILAPKLIANVRRKRSGWPNLSLGKLSNPLAAPRPRPLARITPASNQVQRTKALPAPAAVPAKANPLAIKQAVIKTITFRMVVTSLDFTTNYVVLGEIGTAAGLSAFALVVGPVFYFVHETAWNRFGPPEAGAERKLSIKFQSKSGGPVRLALSRALAKTITFRTIATVMDFTTNFVVVGDAVTAAGLSATGFVLGPFVYLGHEMVWDRYGFAGPSTALPGPANLDLNAAPEF